MVVVYDILHHNVSGSLHTIFAFPPAMVQGCVCSLQSLALRQPRKQDLTNFSCRCVKFCSIKFSRTAFLSCLVNQSNSPLHSLHAEILTISPPVTAHLYSNFKSVCSAYTGVQEFMILEIKVSLREVYKWVKNL